jgi:hypothetical protein
MQVAGAEYTTEPSTRCKEITRGSHPTNTEIARYLRTKQLSGGGLEPLQKGEVASRQAAPASNYLERSSFAGMRARSSGPDGRSSVRKIKYDVFQRLVGMVPRWRVVSTML